MNNEYWTGRYSLNTSQIPSMLTDYQEMIVTTGKYLNVMRESGCPIQYSPHDHTGARTPRISPHFPFAPTGATSRGSKAFALGLSTSGPSLSGGVGGGALVKISAASSSHGMDEDGDSKMSEMGPPLSYRRSTGDIHLKAARGMKHGRKSQSSMGSRGSYGHTLMSGRTSRMSERSSFTSDAPISHSLHKCDPRELGCVFRLPPLLSTSTDKQTNTKQKKQVRSSEKRIIFPAKPYSNY